MTSSAGVAGESILVLNAGSSSLKFCLYGPAASRVSLRGQIDAIGAATRIRARDGADATLIDEPMADVRDGPGAFGALATSLREGRLGEVQLRAVGHRVVHGGARYVAPTRVTPAVLEDLHTLESLAPLHQPLNLAVIEAAAVQFPDALQVACFDTSFHRGRPAVTEIVPLPPEIRAQVQRYGFHGLSYEYIASMLPELAPEIGAGRVIVAHLGNGASLCAMRDRKSVDTTHGFTALDGLCMGTRPGALDPGIVLYLFQTLGLTAAEVEEMLYRRSGLLGISGISQDMRDLLASTEPAARLAIDYFVYRAAKEIGALAAVLGGVDGIVFTAGIGAGSAAIRARICDACAWLGVALDRAANEANRSRISEPGSRVSAWVVPTDEELMIARHTSALLAERAA